MSTIIEADIEEINPEIKQTDHRRNEFIRKVYKIVSIQLVSQYIISLIWSFTAIPEWYNENPAYFAIFLILEIVFVLILSFSQKLPLMYPLNYILLILYTIVNSFSIFGVFVFDIEAIPLIISTLISLLAVAFITFMSYCTLRDFSFYGKKIVSAIITTICLEILMEVLAEVGIITRMAEFIFSACASIAAVVIFILSMLCVTQRVFSRHRESFQLTEHMRAVFLLSIVISILYISITMFVDAIYYVSTN